MLPFVLEQAPPDPNRCLAAFILASDVLDPLVSFGLLERRRSANTAFDWPSYQYRATPLASALLSFDL